MLLPMTIKKFSEETGYSEQAIRDKIHKGVWLEGEQYEKAPDGRTLILQEGYINWVKKKPTSASVQRRRRQS